MRGDREPDREHEHDRPDDAPLLCASSGHTATPHFARSTPISACGSLRREDRVAGDERIRARLPQRLDRVAADAAVHLERGAAAVFVEHHPRAADLVERVVDELLSAEARVHRHDQQQIDLGHDLATRR